MPKIIQNVVMNTTSSDANFRTFVAVIESLLSGSGLVRTADTGQIDSATVTLPATNSSAGYSIWRFADSLQSVAPVFLKFQFGRSGQTNLGFWTTLQVGTATDGAGNLSASTATATITASSGTIPTAGSYACYATHSNGFFAISAGLGYFGATYAGVCDWIVQRVCDNNGSPTAAGVVVIAPPTGNSRTVACQVIQARFSPSFALTTSTGSSLGLVPLASTDSRVGLAPQLPLHFCALPKWRPLVGSASNVAGEVAGGQSFSATLVGTVPRTYIGMAGAFGATAGISPVTQTVVLWED